MTIRDLHHNGHHWTATIFVPTPPDGQTYHLDRRYGSWRITPEHEGSGHIDVLPHVAAALQAAVRKAERVRTRTNA